MPTIAQKQQVLKLQAKLDRERCHYEEAVAARDGHITTMDAASPRSPRSPSSMQVRVSVLDAQSLLQWRLLLLQRAGKKVSPSPGNECCVLLQAAAQNAAPPLQRTSSRIEKAGWRKQVLREVGLQRDSSPWIKVNLEKRCYFYNTATRLASWCVHSG